MCSATVSEVMTLQWDRNTCYYYHYCYFLWGTHYHKATGMEIELSKAMSTRSTTVYYSVSSMLWKALAFPIWSAIDNHWKKKWFL